MKTLLTTLILLCLLSGCGKKEGWPKTYIEDIPPIFEAETITLGKTSIEIGTGDKKIKATWKEEAGKLTVVGEDNQLIGTFDQLENGNLHWTEKNTVFKPTQN